MRRRTAGPADPMMRVGHAVPCEARDVEAMAEAFAEELAQIGFDEARVLRIFRHPFYGGPHLAWRVLGEERLREIVARAVGPWRAMRVRVEDQAVPPESPRLWPRRE